MWEQPPFLENIADPASMLWHKHLVLCVDDHVAIQRDVGVVRTDKAANDVYQRRLAGAGPTKQCRDPPLTHELGLELERAETMLNVDLDHPSTPMRRPTTSLIASERRRADIGTT